jgi:hypothetical protein
MWWDQHTFQEICGGNNKSIGISDKSMAYTAITTSKQCQPFCPLAATAALALSKYVGVGKVEEYAFQECVVGSQRDLGIFNTFVVFMVHTVSRECQTSCLLFI